MAIINNHMAVKPGTVIASPASSVPGYLFCNGATLNRKTYARLFAVIGTLYNKDNGPNTFNLPDFRGDFIRGYLAGSSAEIGTRQGQGLPNITGNLGGSKNILINPSADGAFEVTTRSEGWAGTSAGTATTVANISFDASRVSGVYGKSGDVVPRNHALNFFIKY